MQIQPQFLTVGGLLSARLFRIPEYQRAYSWLPKQRSDLFGDIQNIYKKIQQSKDGDVSHFMATIIGLRNWASPAESEVNFLPTAAMILIIHSFARCVGERSL